MNEALLKFLNFINANFWDWQFFVFIFFAVLAFCYQIINREKPFHNSRLQEFIFEKTGKSDRLNCIYILAANIILIALLVSIVGIPIPQTHDEFGYLLAADTFLHGRLVNPTPTSPQHFEFFHILLKPVYAAKYPPLQGFFLAVGTLLTGLPVAGVWLSSLLGSLSIYWLLRAFFSLRWSLFGTILWVFAPLNILWCDSYWGGHVAVLGGALSAGAFFRYLRIPTGKYLLIWGAGIFLLLNSRIYEGAVLTAILMLFWVYDRLKNRKTGKEFYRRTGVFVLIIFINFLWIGFYNYSVSQNPFVLPYSLHHAQYHRVPLFVFQNVDETKPEIPPVIKKLDERWVSEFYENYKNPLAAIKSTAERIPIYLVWLTRSPFLLILFLLSVFTFAKGDNRDFIWKMRVILAVFLVALVLTTFKGDRFIAPVVGIAFVLLTAAAKMLYRKGGFWKITILSLPLIAGGGFILGTLALELKRTPVSEAADNLQTRRQIVENLRSQGGKHLIFVETDEARPADARFYVYNEAEIANSRIIWAHNLNSDENRVLIEHYGNRKIWLLKNINSGAVLAEYDVSK